MHWIITFREELPTEGRAFLGLALSFLVLAAFVVFLAILVLWARLRVEEFAMKAIGPSEVRFLDISSIYPHPPQWRQIGFPPLQEQGTLSEMLIWQVLQLSLFHGIPLVR